MAAAQDPKAQVILRSKDGRAFLVDMEVARKFKAIEVMLMEVPPVQLSSGGNVEDHLKDEYESVIPLNTVDGTVLEFILEWCEHHREVYMGQVGVPSDYGEEWDRNFMEGLNKESLLAVTTGAYYLDIPELITLTCKHIALRIEGHTALELREFFNIPNPNYSGRDQLETDE